MSVFGVLALIGPVLLLATTVVSLWAHGPLGWVAAVGLVVGVVAACAWTVRRTRRWWAGTKAPERVVVGPAERRRALLAQNGVAGDGPAGGGLSGGGTGRAPAAPPAAHEGTSPG